MKNKETYKGLKTGDRFINDGSRYRIISFDKKANYVKAVQVGQKEDGFLSTPISCILQTRIPKMPQVSKKALRLIERLRSDDYPDLEAAKWGYRKAKYDMVKYIAGLEDDVRFLQQRVYTAIQGGKYV